VNNNSTTKARLTHIRLTAILAKVLKVRKLFLDGFLGLDPASTLFIDDMQVNLDAASALGIRSLLFTSVESCCRDLLSLGVHLACAST
jgi:hypothetical protein